MVKNMQVKKYHKLVRDNIIEIIKKDGKECDYEILSDEDYIACLKNKLKEETDELSAADNDEIIAEIADVLEVIEAIAKYYHLNIEDIMKYKEAKALKNGKFAKRILLLETREDD